MYKKYRQQSTMGAETEEPDGSQDVDNSTEKMSNKEASVVDEEADDSVQEASVLLGDFTEAAKLNKRALKVFISSTFTDTKAERNYLMKEVYPRIREFCNARGVDFSVFDFRWGIRDQDTDSHKTPEICLSQIDTCLSQSIDAPCFIFLSGNRYGWTPLPRLIPEHEFNALVKEIEEEEEKELVQKYYTLDKNSDPQRYVLQPISVNIPERQRRRDMDAMKKLRSEWSATESKLLSILSRSALRSPALTAAQRRRWDVSVTELEVQRGILDNPAASTKALCLQRDLTHLPATDADLGAEERRLLARFVDLRPGPDTSVDEEVQGKIRDLRGRVEGKGVKTVTFSQPWSSQGITQETHGDYLQEVGDTLYDVITSGVGKALKQQKEVDAMTSEAAFHLMFARGRGEAFYGRGDLVRRVQEYLTSRQRCPLVVYGASGSGKTSVMAATALLVRESLRTSTTHPASHSPRVQTPHPAVPESNPAPGKTTPDSSGTRRSTGDLATQSPCCPVLVVRFCGTSSASSSARDLIQAVVSHIYRAYRQEAPLMRTFDECAAALSAGLSLATREKPLVVLIDSLDQLDDEDMGRGNLSWLPTALPEHAHVVISTLPEVGGCLKALQKTAIPPGNYLQVQPLSMAEIQDITGGYMEGKGRVLQPEQLSVLRKLAADSTEEEPTVLRLKLLLDAATQLTSEVKFPDLPVTVRGLISRFLAELERRHGQLLVSRVFALLGAATWGLSEETLLDILATDDEVLDSVLQYHQPPIRRIPQVVMARLKHDLEGYLVERGAFGRSVWSWYHRQFWESAREHYLSDPDDVTATHRKMADYYTETLHEMFPERGLPGQPYWWKSEQGEVTFNQAKLCQLPDSLMFNRREFELQICNAEFIANKCAAGLGRQLIRDLSTAKLQTGDRWGGGGNIQKTLQFVQREMHVLEKAPVLAYQQALNTSDSDKAPALALQHSPAASEGTGGGLHPWFEEFPRPVTRINKGTGENPCVFTIQADIMTITGLAVKEMIPQGGSELSYIFSCGRDGVRVWEDVTGSCVYKLNCGHVNNIQTVETPGAYLVIISLQGNIMEDVSTLLQIYQFTFSQDGEVEAELMSELNDQEFHQPVQNHLVLAVTPGGERIALSAFALTDWNHYSPVLQVWGLNVNKDTGKVSVELQHSNKDRALCFPGDNYKGRLCPRLMETSTDGSHLAVVCTGGMGWCLGLHSMDSPLVTLDVHSCKAGYSGVHAGSLDIRSLAESVDIILATRGKEILMFLTDFTKAKVCLTLIRQFELEGSEGHVSAIFGKHGLVLGKGPTIYTVGLDYEQMQRDWREGSVVGEDGIDVKGMTKYPGHTTDAVVMATYQEKPMYVTGASQGELKLWQDFETSSVVAPVKHAERITASAHVPGTHDFLSCAGKSVWWLTVPEKVGGECVKARRDFSALPGEIKAVAVTPGGGNSNKLLVLLARFAKHIYFSPLDKLGTEEEFKHYDPMQNLKAETTLDDEFPMIVSPNGKYLTLGLKGETRYNIGLVSVDIDGSTLGPLVLLKGFDKRAQGCTFYGDCLLAFRSSQNKNTEIRVWNYETQEELRCITLGNSQLPTYKNQLVPLCDVTNIPKSSLIATCDYQGFLHVHDLATMTAVTSVHVDTYRTLNIVRATEDGMHVITTGDDKWLYIYDIPGLKRAALYYVGGYVTTMSVCAESDGTTLIYCGDASGENHLLRVNLN